jgi:hypothetical protein
MPASILRASLRRPPVESDTELVATAHAASERLRTTTLSNRTGRIV